MGDPIYITIDDMTVQDGENITPTKPVGEEILNGTFRELVDSMFDTNPDQVYNHKYNLEEKQRIERIRQRYTNAINHPNGAVEIYARKGEVNEEQVNGPYNIDSKVGEYTSDILNVSETNIDGEGVPYRSIDLLIKCKGGGAYL